MFGSHVLDVAIGIIFIFLIVSLICSAIREGIEAWLKTRASYLEYGIRELLHDKTPNGIVKSFYEHPLIHSLFLGEYKHMKEPKKPGLFARGGDLPSYIPSKNFAQALMDIAAKGPKTNIINSDPNSPLISLENIRRNILNIQNEAVQRALLVAIDSAQGDLNLAQANIEAWYNSSMDRVSGWYKRSTSWILFWIGLFVAVSMNINIIAIAGYLDKNDAARAAVVARAQEAAKDTTFLSRNYEQAVSDINSLDLPIGWNNVEFRWPYGEKKVIIKTASGTKEIIKKNGWWNCVFSPLFGWLLTAIAATMGAPFWFDLLNKVMVIRSTVKPHEKSLEEDSEDRQLKKTQPKPVVIPSPESKIQNPPKEPGQLLIPSPLDEESSIDGCSDHEHTDNPVTNDEELPLTRGGVA